MSKRSATNEGSCPSAGWTLDQIQSAFWKTFHKEGELWFDYLSDEETCEQCTRGMWSEFADNLDAPNAEREVRT